MPSDATTPTTQPTATPENAAAQGVPATPQAAPAPAAPEPAEDSNLLNTILGLIKPEAKQVTPPPDKAEGKGAEPAKAAEPAKPAEPPPQKAPVRVKKKEPAPAPITEDKVVETVRRVIDEASQRAAPPIRPPEENHERKKEEVPLPDDVTAEERDELELYRFIEAKDPSKKGLVQKGLKFIEENKKFLEKRIQEEGDDYDPASDPQYKRFLDANEPKLTNSEKRRYTIQRETDALKQEAIEQARKELMPEIQSTKQKLLEMEEKPKVAYRVRTFAEEVTQVMPEEVVKFWRENNHDLNKLKEQFPIEHDAIVAASRGALKAAEEFLRLRSGLTQLRPEDPDHAFLQDFIDNQARVLAERGGSLCIRDGKQFVHPYQFKDGMESRYWTFENEDILQMLKLQAGREAKSRIANEYQRLETASEARKRRAGAQNGATTTPAAAADRVSPSIPASPAPGASQSTAPDDRNILNSILGFGTR